MDQTSLRAQLEQALSAEPPLGNLVGNSLRAGRKLRRRRRAGAAALSAAVVVVVGAAATLMSGAGHKARQPQPVAAADARTAYVAVGTDDVVPISLATNAAGTPIRVPVTADTGLNTTYAAVTPDGRTVYEVGMTAGRPDTTVTPIDTATHVAGPTITLPNTYPSSIAIDPNGQTAYLGGQDGVYPINIATNTAGKRITIPGLSWAMAFTPDGKTLYVLDDVGYGTLTVTPILTATNTALAPITLLPKGTRNPAPYGWDIGITPNGKTAYVVAGVQEGKPYDSSVVPVDLVTNRALAPIKLEASGLASGLVIAPGGSTAYVLSSRAVTPIDTTTNQAEPAINLPGSAGYADSMALTPNGKTLYVFTPRGVVPIRTASRTVLPMITIPGIAPFTDAAAITPDGKTVYVATSTDVVPVSTATNTAGSPINVSAAVGPQSCPVKRSCVPAPIGIAFAW
jgi:DNA-binding beta-propeller fold protein YncE